MRVPQSQKLAVAARGLAEAALLSMRTNNQLRPATNFHVPYNPSLNSNKQQFPLKMKIGYIEATPIDETKCRHQQPDLASSKSGIEMKGSRPTDNLTDMHGIRSEPGDGSTLTTQHHLHNQPLPNLSSVIT
ncbi:hypothetical protein DSO57_1028351 [Entomophthora muscae]|uniref:Uncharacterized protein n=1 Tax=Entomophthora muscae TaxID=34485 RepID=A0ACC2UM89_9FUNG|nr:hypothetical protein DSO57_1028351 [Entomophthora muscae]